MSDFHRLTSEQLTCTRSFCWVFLEAIIDQLFYLRATFEELPFRLASPNVFRDFIFIIVNVFPFLLRGKRMIVATKQVEGNNTKRKDVYFRIVASIRFDLRGHVFGRSHILSQTSGAIRRESEVGQLYVHFLPYFVEFFNEYVRGLQITMNDLLCVVKVVERIDKLFENVDALVACEALLAHDECF